MLKQKTVIAGFNDIALMSQSIQQGGRHLRIAKYGWPFSEAQVGGDDGAGLLIRFVDQVKRQRTTDLVAQRQGAQFIQYYQVGVHEPNG